MTPELKALMAARDQKPLGFMDPHQEDMGDPQSDMSFQLGKKYPNLPPWLTAGAAGVTGAVTAPMSTGLDFMSRLTGLPLGPAQMGKLAGLYPRPEDWTPPRQ